MNILDLKKINIIVLSLLLFLSMQIPVFASENAAEVKRFRVAFLIGLAVWLWSALPQALIYCLMGSRMLRLFAMN